MNPIFEYGLKIYMKILLKVICNFVLIFILQETVMEHI